MDRDAVLAAARLGATVTGRLVRPQPFASSLYEIAVEGTDVVCRLWRNPARELVLELKRLGIIVRKQHFPDEAFLPKAAP